MRNALTIIALLILCSCAARKPTLEAKDFLSDGLSHPKKFDTAEIQSRYWAHGNFIVHFISNSNERNKNQTPIIYIHGLGGNLDGYSELIRIIHHAKNARPYYAIDLPPFGRSVLQDPELTIHDYSEMLQDFIAQLPTPKVNLVCHSMGGQVCIEFALANPNQIQLLTLISPAGTYEKSPFVDDAVHRFAGINFGAIDHPYATTFGDLDWYSPDFTRRMLTNDPFMLVAVDSFRQNFRTRIQKLKTKTLILWGREDKLFSFENGLFLKENIENSTLYIIDGAAHTPMKTHAELISKLIQKYL